MINILELESSLGFGGQEHRTQRVINGLNKDKFKVFYALNPGSKSFEKPIDCEFVEFNLSKVYNIFEIFKICRFVREKKISIIATHSGKDGNIGAIVGKLTGAKVVRTRHLQTPIRSAFSYNVNDKIIAVSNAVKAQLVSQGVRGNLIDVIYTGVDTARFNPNFTKDIKAELNLSSDCVVVGIVAVLRAAKNHQLLIEAFSELNLENTALVIVGDGPQETRVREIIAGKKNIFMLGNRLDVSEFMGSLDVFVLPSKMEALGTAILEAQSCGVPCIGSRVGGIVEAIMEDESGFLFNSKDELKLKLKQLVEDRALRQKFGKFAREYITQIFSIETMINRTEILYESLVDEEKAL